MIDFKFENSNQPEKGSLLISEPFLADHYFARSVVFLCDHNESGSFGFVLNNYIDAELNEIVGEFSELETRVSIGGPVDTSNLFFIHGLGDEVPDSLMITEGLYIGGNFESVKKVIAEDPTKLNSIRFFIGYSGWDQGQLEGELKENSWIVINDADASMVLDTNREDIWKQMMEELGGKFKIMSTFPMNPADN